MLFVCSSPLQLSRVDGGITSLLFIGHTFAELSVHNTSKFVSLCFMYILGQVEYVRL